MGYLQLVLGLLRMALAPAALIALVAVGQAIALLFWDRMVARELQRADQAIEARTPRSGLRRLRRRRRTGAVRPQPRRGRRPVVSATDVELAIAEMERRW